MLVSTWGSFNNPFESNYSENSTSVYPHRHIPATWVSTSSAPVSGPSYTMRRREPTLELQANTRPPSIPSCLDQSSAFFKVLTAPYRPPPPVQVASGRPIDARELEMSHSAVNWSRSSARFDSPDEEDVTPVAASPSHYDSMERAIYKPHGNWEWAEGLAIENATTLAHLGCEFCAATHIQTGANHQLSWANVFCSHQEWYFRRSPHNFRQQIVSILSITKSIYPLIVLSCFIAGSLGSKISGAGSILR
jgi:hypothetical protein